MNNKNYHPLPEPVAPELLERVRRLSPALLSDGMQNSGIARNGCMDADIVPVDESKVLLGTACTVETSGGDNFPVHVAIYQGCPGYVLVVAGRNDTERAYLGDLLAGAAQATGLDGIVVDGCVRDKQALAELDIPVYARGFMPRGPVKEKHGEINTPVQCAGVVVTPGDLVFGDADGVVVVPRSRLEEVLDNAEKKLAYEIQRREVIETYQQGRECGGPLPALAPEWVTDILFGKPDKK